jgi:hypothetical protein
MKLALLLTVFVGWPLAAQTSTLFVSIITPQLCSEIQPFLTEQCVPHIIAVASNLPENTTAVKFTLNVIDSRGKDHVEYVLILKQQDGTATLYKNLDFIGASVSAIELSDGAEIQPLIP